MEKPYRITINLSIIDDLGVNLYSNVPAVISEVVANAWDADAESVNIRMDKTARSIVIEDDGLGMSEKDINEKYLQVGYKKRESDAGTITDKGRHVMGRKGIGKLSLFAIAETIRIESAQSGAKKAGLIMILKDIKDKAKKKEDYYPNPIPDPGVGLERGTRITLTDLKTKITDNTVSHLRKRLARRFSVIGSQHDFNVSIDDNPIGIRDRDYFKKIGYLWTIGAEEPYRPLAVNAKKFGNFEDTVQVNGQEHKVKGWIGAFDKQENIDEGNNSISIFAWGKVIQEDLLPKIKASGIYSKYLIGEIEADFLDSDSLDDIVTSDRQSLKENDLRYECLLQWFRDVIKKVGTSWLKWTGETAADEAQNIPAIKEWFGLLNADEQEFANKLFKKIGPAVKDKNNASREIYKHAIIAFERLRLKNTLSSIDKLQEDNSIEELFRQSFTGIDDLEAVTYHEITKGRLEVITTFEKIADNEKEKVIQKYIFDHLWLLDASWASDLVSDKRMEKTIDNAFGTITKGLTQEEKRGRIDIKYRNVAGQHIIIELKKYNARVKEGALLEQLTKYHNALDKCLREQFQRDNPDIEVVAVMGKKPTGPSNQQQLIDKLKTINARMLTYDELISQTQREYAEYLEANAKTKKIVKIIDELGGVA
ncbi:ATP-binding protein [Candidatus Saccharibacteria bacterium]|nr:ATP-binding protein [Candidatus Saccharibacteria bacterium]